MTIKVQQEFKKLIKEGTIEVFSSTEGKAIIKGSIIDGLKSQDGQSAITDAMRSPGGQDAVVNALRSKGGQDAIVDAMNSMDGQEAIKRGSLAALKSEEGKEILIDNFVEGFHEVVVPILSEHDTKIKSLERKMGVVAI